MLRLRLAGLDAEFCTVRPRPGPEEGGGSRNIAGYTYGKEKFEERSGKKSYYLHNVVIFSQFMQYATSILSEKS